MGDPAALKKVALKVDFGIFSMDTEWESDPRERQAAWELYVELSTRIAVQELSLEGGSTREALSSLYAVFGLTRQILRAAGPDVGAIKRSVGYLALSVLNKVIRPFLSEWHPRLSKWEHERAADVSPFDHERNWPDDTELRGGLERMRSQLEKYNDALAEIAGIKRKRLR